MGLVGRASLHDGSGACIESGCFKRTGVKKPWSECFDGRLKGTRKEGKMDIYVGGLSYNVTEDDLKQAFEGFGKVESVNIIKDRFTGKSKGFGFVQMPVEEEAQAAIGGLNGKEIKGRTISVNKARPKTEGRQGTRGRRSPWSGQGR
jgi:RNA recognition motif-containing protein